MATFFLLSAFSHAQDEIILKKHTAPVKTVAFSPDGKLLASGGEDKIIILWDLRSAEIFRTIKTVYSVKSLYFISNEQLLAACGEDVLLLDLNGKILRTFSGYTTDVWSLSYNETAGKLVAGSYAKSIRIWDFSTGKPALILEGHERSCLPVKFNPTGTLIASGSLDKTVRLWDASTGKQINSHEIHSENIFALDFHPSGKYLASCSADKSIRLWNIETGKIVKTYAGHDGAVMDVRFSSDGHHLLSCDSKNTVILWETVSGKKVWSYTGHKGPVNSVCFSSGEAAFASASDDHTIIYWKPDKKAFLAGSWFEKEIEKEVAASALFEPRSADESRQDFTLREARADRYLDSLYNLNYHKYIETLEKVSIE